MTFELRVDYPVKPRLTEVTVPIENTDLLLRGGCHVDHEGFDLNEIEQEYYRAAGISLTTGDVWYKDGDGDRNTMAILQPWIQQTNTIQSGVDQLIVDHSHFVFKFPIRGEAEKQIREFAINRPELLRLVSTQFKCGLDFCVDYLVSGYHGWVEPIVHIEWDYTNFEDMFDASCDLTSLILMGKWKKHISKIREFNISNSLGAFEQADFRSKMIFKDIAYKLIPTLYK